MSRNAYIDHDKKLIVFWSPKCACTSTVSVFSDYILGGNSIGKRRTWLRDNGYHYTYKDESINEAYDCAIKGYTTIVITRNPLSRIVSSYINKFYFYQGNFISKYSELERFSQNFYRYIDKERDLDTSYKGLSFEQFLDEIQKRKSKGQYLDHHWDTQISEKMPSEISFDHIIKCESYDSDMSDFAKKFDFSYEPFPRVNETKYHGQKSSKSYFGGISSIDIIKSNIALNKNNLLNDENIKLIENIYKKDYQLLGY